MLGEHYDEKRNADSSCTSSLLKFLFGSSIVNEMTHQLKKLIIYPLAILLRAWYFFWLVLETYANRVVVSQPSGWGVRFPGHCGHAEVSWSEILPLYAKMALFLISVFDFSQKINSWFGFIDHDHHFEIVIFVLILALWKYFYYACSLTTLVPWNLGSFFPHLTDFLYYDVFSIQFSIGLLDYFKCVFSCPVISFCKMFSLKLIGGEKYDIQANDRPIHR